MWVGAVRRGALRIELSQRCPQPSLGDRGERVDRALEDDLAVLGAEDAEYQEQVGVVGGQGHDQAGREGAGDLGVDRERPGADPRAFGERMERAGGRFW